MEFLPQDKLFRYLTLILSLITVILLVREIFFKPVSLDIIEPIVSTTSINIKTDIFSEPGVAGLVPFSEIKPPDFVGRDNPFEPYSLDEYLDTFYSTSTATTTIEASTTTPETTTTTPETATSSPLVP